MSDRIKKIKIKQADGTMSGYYSIGADAQNIDFDNGFNLDNIVGSINPDESGSIATQLSKSIKYYDCVADMKADTTLNGGGAARTLGYYEPGDGGGALYQIIDDSDARYSTSTDDGGSVHDLTNGNKALLNIDNNTIWVKQFGAYGDNTHDDTNELTRLFTFVRNSSTIRKIMFNIGRYYITNSLSVPSNVIIEGINQSCLPENVNRNKFSSIVRKTNITIFELIGEPYSVSGGGISNVQINNLTIRTITNSGYFDAPAIVFFRSLYNKFNNLNFYGNGKALYFMEGCFDSRFSNCEFAGNALLETKSTVADEYHDAGWYGTNQIFFYGCRWESYTLDKVCYFGNSTHDMNFINCKWEGKTQNNGAVIEGGRNSNIIFDDCHMTCNEDSLCSLFKFEKIRDGKFNFYFVDNTSAERNLPYFIFNEGSGLDINFNGIANIDKYLCEYYIENTNSLSINSMTGTFFSAQYYNPSRIRHFKNPQLQNKSFMLYNNNYSDGVGDHRIYIQMNKTLNKNDAKVWSIYPNYNSYANDVTKIDIISPTKSIITLYEGSCKFKNKVEMPTLSTAPSYIANGEIYVNTYSDSSNPLWTFGVNSSGKRIGWSDAAPTTGTHTKGTIIFNTNPSAGGIIGWVCITAGSPGTWKTFGAIES